MRLYIRALERLFKKGEINYTLATAAGHARFWPTIGVAEGVRNQITWSGGIMVASPFGKLSTTDFRIEPGPHDGFVISCECPLQLESTL